MIPFGVSREIVQSPRQKRRAMTVGIGAICNQKTLPGAIMLGVDLRVTYTAKDVVLGKHDLTSKLFQLPYGFCAAVAGTMPFCETLISLLWAHMEELAPVSQNLQLEHIKNAATNAGDQILFSLFDKELVNELGMTRNEWIDRQSDPKLQADGRTLLAKINHDASCLIAGFIRSSPVLIRMIGKNVPEEIVSHSAIGIGAIFALQKMAVRTQGPYCSIQRTALAVSEGLRYARTKGRGYVGPPANCFVLEPGIARQFDPQSAVLRGWSRTIKRSATEVLDSEVCRTEFRQILTEVSKPATQSTS